MEKVKVFTEESLLGISKCFSGSEELNDFINHIELMNREQLFLTELNSRIHDPDVMAYNYLRQVVITTIFCREHIELIKQLIGALKYDEITEEEYQAMLNKEKEELQEDDE